MDISKLKVADLKKELKERGLTTSGTKPELVARLSEALQSGDASKENTSGESLNLEKGAGEEEEEEEEDVPLDPDVESLLETSKEDEKATEPPPAKKVALEKAKPLTETEKLQMRAQRFGVTSEDLKKEARAARFNLKTTAGDKGLQMNAPADLDKLKQRADRFGTVVSQSLTKMEEAERIRRRKERFGVVTPAEAGTKKTSWSAPKVSNLTPAEEEKRRKRAQRFGLS